MHKIDRYGVIALVFMAVTFLAVYFWDERGKPLSKKEAKQSNAVAKLEPRPIAKPEAPEHRPAATKRSAELPLSKPEDRPRLGAGEVAPTAAPSSKASSVPRPLPQAVGSGAESQATAPQSSPAAQSKPQPAQPEQPRGREVRPASTSSDLRNQPRETEVLPRAAEKSEPAAQSYTVAAGDTLERIALRMLGDRNRWSEIQELNGGLDPKKLWVGRKLKLPPASAPGAKVAAAEPALKEQPKAKPAGARSYVVKKGDILGVIAQRELGTTKAIGRILALNPNLNPDRLLAGTTIYLPGESAGEQSIPLELATPASKKVAQAEPKQSGGYKVR